MRTSADTKDARGAWLPASSQDWSCPGGARNFVHRRGSEVYHNVRRDSNCNGDAYMSHVVAGREQKVTYIRIHDALRRVFRKESVYMSGHLLDLTTIFERHIQPISK